MFHIMTLWLYALVQSVIMYFTLWHYLRSRFIADSVTTCLTLWHYGCLHWSWVCIGPEFHSLEFHNRFHIMTVWLCALVPSFIMYFNCDTMLCVESKPRVSQYVLHCDSMVVCLGQECHNVFHIMTVSSKFLADSVTTCFTLWQYGCLPSSRLS